MVMLKLQTLLKTGQSAGGIFCRYQSSISSTRKIKDASFRSSVENFKDMTERRQSEALRSVILEVDSKDVCGRVYHHCKQFGDISNAFLYTLHDERNLMLVEYKNVDSIKETFKCSGFQSNAVHWPNRVLTVCNTKLNPSLSNDAPIQVDNAVAPKIANILRNAETFDEQVDLLYEHTCLTDLSIRLKYVTALQTQTIINEFLDEIFPNAKVYPFGSTVNGFGKMGCDLDMALRFDDVLHRSNENDGSPLEFQGNKFENAEEIKKKEGRQVKCIASLIEYFVPRVNGVSAFHGARVPIVRYFDENIHSSVDLSVNNLDGFHITDLMYTMGMLDRRVRPFIFMVRRWAKEFEITRYTARDNFTNFQLSYMCLTFLQQLKQPIIPTLDDILRQMDRSKSKEPKNSEQSKIFMFDCDRFQFETKNSDTVLELFKQFLDYYEAFDFSKYMISMRSIEMRQKPDPSPLYLENVFDSTHPWGGNVSDAETSTLKIMIRQTQQELEQCSNKPNDQNQDWGLLEIISKIK